jgi:hypothetical protein
LLIDFFVNFICPECGNDCAQEKHVGLIEYREVLSFGPNGSVSEATTIDYDYDSVEFKGIACSKCGLKLGTTEKEAFEWLAKRGMLKRIE